MGNVNSGSTNNGVIIKWGSINSANKTLVRQIVSRHKVQKPRSELGVVLGRVTTREHTVHNQLSTIMGSHTVKSNWVVGVKGAGGGGHGPGNK